MKLVIVVGTRPEVIRLSATIKHAVTYYDTVLVHTGQNYDPLLNDIFFDELGIPKPHYTLNCSRGTVGEAVGDIISKSYNLLSELKPDALLILGDTNSCLCAYSAKRLKIPIFHIEAGNRCHDPNVPEEINRRIIDHLSDVNMCYMEHARRNLLQEGIKPQYTFVVGSPMREVLNSVSESIDKCDVLNRLNISHKQYFVLSVHREENITNMNKLDHLIDCINKIVNTYHKPIIFTVHPRTQKMLTQKNITLPEQVITSIPFGLIDYCCLQKHAMCVISDSGTLTEESTILNFPAVLIRDSTEHPEGIDSGNIMIGNVSWNNLSVSLDMAMTQTHWNIIDSYEVTDFSRKVCGIISSYVGIVNKFVWMK